MQETERREIDGFTYQFNRMNVTQALKLITKIMRVLGLGLGNGNTDEVAGKLITSLDDATVLAIVKESLTGVQFLKPEVEGDVKLIKPFIVECFDLHFAQFGSNQLLHLYNLLKANLEVNFGSFFAEGGPLRKFMEQAKAKTAKMLEVKN